jgi:hypothetical protein
MNVYIVNGFPRMDYAFSCPSISLSYWQKFIKTQLTRSDIDHSLYHHHRDMKLEAVGDAAADESFDDDDDDSECEYPVALRVLNLHQRLSGDGHGADGI